MNIAENADDILREAMHKRSKTIALIVLVVMMMLMLAVGVAAGGSTSRSTSRGVPAGPFQDLTPGPEQSPESQAGSTDGIFWMGIAILLIAFLPVLTSKSFWR